VWLFGMRSLIRSVVQRKDGGLVGRTIKVGPYTGKVEAHLGDGGFATIYRVRDTSSGAVYALKHMRLAGEADARTDCETEVETMKRLRGHPNILTLRAVAYAGPKGAEQEAFLLLDLCRDTLVNYLHERSGQLSNGDVLTIFHSTAKAVAVMHHQSPPLAHRCNTCKLVQFASRLQPWSVLSVCGNGQQGPQSGEHPAAQQRDVGAVRLWQRIVLGGLV